MPTSAWKKIFSFKRRYMREGGFEHGEPQRAEFPENVPEALRLAIENFDPENITEVKVDEDEDGRLVAIHVRREGLVNMPDGPGSSDPTYNTTTIYKVEYKGGSPRRLIADTTFDGPAAAYASVERRFGEAPNYRIEL